MAALEIWWPPGEIRFNTGQVRWLIENLPSLREGRWPAGPRETDPGERTSVPRSAFRHAPFESAEMIVAELDTRLTACGQDGWLTKAVFALGEDSRTLGLTETELNRRVGRCLKYVSGWQRKATTYHEFSAHRRATPAPGFKTGPAAGKIPPPPAFSYAKLPVSSSSPDRSSASRY